MQHIGETVKGNLREVGLRDFQTRSGTGLSSIGTGLAEVSKLIEILDDCG